ncbi:MAG: sigma-70 family RNA polymerase sigma factor [Minisyncoccia bacterium]
MESDTTLIRRAKEDDTAAFETLVSRYVPSVFNFSARFSGNTILAEDITQETFIKVWKNLRRFDEDRPFKPWVFQIARNTATDMLRKKEPLSFSQLMSRSKKEDADTFEETIADEEALPDELFERKEIQAEVLSALQKLSQRDRAVLLLRYEEALSFDDIALTMNAPMNTVKSWHRRALARLKEILAPNHA